MHPSDCATRFVPATTRVVPMRRVRCMPTGDFARFRRYFSSGLWHGWRMQRSLMALTMCVVIGCASDTAAPRTQATPDAFAGAWRSTASSLEFVRLTVGRKASTQDVLTGRLTFSGVAWEGEGRVDGDSLV